MEGMVFGSGPSKGFNGPKTRGKGKRNGHDKAHEGGTTRHKQSNISRPTPGLIFGPTRGEIELSVNGKRLRVERDNVGRAGGSVETVRSGDGREEPVAQSDEGNKKFISLSSENGEMSTDLVMYGIPSESGGTNA